ncbi:MAG: transporter substrate-binding domain-containing protein [Chitinivibrionia bacterium]|nr:transporter substrate-binding domain-containing protein [Chitinivibrionia bacterium]
MISVRLKSICLFFIIILTLGILSGCNTSNKKQTDDVKTFSSYRDIPGVTQGEIETIEALRKQTDVFVYGMLPGTDAFIDANGEIRGFSALLCEFMTKLFGIKFVPKHFTWNELLVGLESGEIDFTGDLTATEERRKTYFMTDAISQRLIKYYRIKDSPPLCDIALERTPKYAFLEGTMSTNNVLLYAIEEFEPIYVSDYEQAYELLKTQEADAFIAEDVSEAYFDVHGDVEVKDFFPLISAPVSFSTQNPKLVKFVDVMQKALDNSCQNYLNNLYDQGHKEYLKDKFLKRLTQEEIDYIRDNPNVFFASQYDNYPATFYNSHTKEWQGICFDIYKEITSITGLNFLVINDEFAEFRDLIDMLNNDKASFISELILTPEREGKYLWTNKMFLSDKAVLVSKANVANIDIGRINFARVGLVKGTAHTELFMKWFPNHPNTIIYESYEASENALNSGKVDIIMSSNSRLLYMTNYREVSDLKSNFTFDHNFESGIGFNKNEKILHSIFDKALEFIDTKTISEQWSHRMYNYKLKIIQAQVPLLLAMSGLCVCIIILIAILFVKSTNTAKQLETIVEERTKELSMQAAMLTALFDSIPDHIFVKDSNLRFIQCNKSMSDYFGLEKDEIVGKDYSDGMNFPEEVIERYNELDRKVINDKQTITLEEEIPDKDGKKQIYETLRIPLITDDDSSSGLLFIARDITKHRETELMMVSTYRYASNLNNALARITKSPSISSGNLKFAADVIAQNGCLALNVTRISIWSVDEKFSNFENISCYVGGTIQEYYQQHYFDMLNHKQYSERLKSERMIVTNSIKESNHLYEVLKIHKRDLCAVLDAPIFLDGKLVGVVRAEQDCNEEFPQRREWKIEEQNFVASLADLMTLAMTCFERRKARDEAEIANQAKSFFLASMSHEIRTPMNAILGVTEMMEQDETLPKNISEGLDRIYNSCDLLLNIINDILDFSKIEAGKLEITASRYDVASLISDSVQLNIMRIESKPIEFKLNIDKNIPTKLVGDEIRIKQILNNLLSNAFKYTEAGKVTLSIESIPNHKDYKRGVTLVLKVQDTGYGMSKEQLDRIYDKYSRFHDKTHKIIEGTGLGMTITQSLVNLMKGEINIESEINKGSTFIVQIPQETVDDEKLGADTVAELKQFHLNKNITRKKRTRITREPMPYGKVLIVDDMETNLFVAEGLMRLYQLKIDTATNGRSAIEKIKNGNLYDVIFMDHMMPEMDGMETTKHIRELDYNSPIVALTANAVVGQSDIFLQNGFDDFIPKPIDIRHLNTVLNKYVRDKQPPEVIEAAHSYRRRKTDYPTEQQQNINARLLDSFIKDSRKTVNLLETLCAENNFEDEERLRKFTIAVHGIKSSLINIGETELSEWAFKLETSGRNKNIDIIVSQTPEFLDKLRAILTNLEQKSDEIESEKENGADENIDELRDKLLSIQYACADYNRKGVLDLLADIKNCSKETKEVLDKINGCITHSNFEEAESAIKAYLAELSNTAKKAKTYLRDKKVSGLNIAKGVDLYEGDEKTYLKILRAYSKNIRSLLDAIKTFDETVLSDYEIIVHGIKGASYDIFAEKIGYYAEALEKAAKTRDLSFINNNNPQFFDTLTQFIDEIDIMLANFDAENPKPKKDKISDEILTKLFIACKEYNMDGANAVLKDIEEYQYETDGELANYLIENINAANFKQIVEKLTEKKGG